MLPPKSNNNFCRLQWHRRTYLRFEIIEFRWFIWRRGGIGKLTQMNDYWQLCVYIFSLIICSLFTPFRLSFVSNANLWESGMRRLSSVCFFWFFGKKLNSFAEFSCHAWLIKSRTHTFAHSHSQNRTQWNSNDFHSIKRNWFGGWAWKKLNIICNAIKIAKRTHTALSYCDGRTHARRYLWSDGATTR